MPQSVGKNGFTNKKKRDTLTEADPPTGSMDPLPSSVSEMSISIWLSGGGAGTTTGGK